MRYTYNYGLFAMLGMDFGVLDLNMYWEKGTVVKAMLGMDARTPPASST